MSKSLTLASRVYEILRDDHPRDLEFLANRVEEKPELVADCIDWLIENHFVPRDLKIKGYVYRRGDQRDEARRASQLALPFLEEVP